MAEPLVDVTVSREGIQALTRAIRAEEDGKELRKQLAKDLRDALKPAADQAKAGIMAMHASGSRSSPALRSSIARKIRPEIKLGGRWTGARVKARKTLNVRHFANAPKRTQAAGGWRAPSWGRSWRVQHGRTDWFDHAMEADAARYRAAIHDAMEAMARRLAQRAESR